MWVDAPDGEPWEIYTVLADVEMPEGRAAHGRARRRRAVLRERAGVRSRVAADAVIDRELARRASAEFVGTAFLVAVVVGSGIAAQRLSPHNTGLQLLENSTATGAALVALILSLGPISGAHFNPVVTMADRILGGISTRDSGVYVVCQIAGACVGAMAANVMFELPAQSTCRRTCGLPARSGSRSSSPRSGC